MSLFKEVEVKCPKCGNELKIKIYNSINVTVSPELLESVENFSAFSKVCDKCGTYLPIEYSCMFHDMDKKYIIWSTSNVEDLNTLFEDCKQWIDLGYKLRFVDTNKDLVEKVSILKNDLRDTIIEYIKIKIMLQIDEFKNEEDLEKIRFIDKESDKLNFSLLKNDKTIQSISIDIEEYNKYLDNIPDTLYDKYDVKSVIVKPFIVAQWIVDNGKHI